MSELVHVSMPLVLPAVDDDAPPGRRDDHLRACLDDAADRAVREHADVLYFTRVVSPDDVAAQLAEFPGCLVCAGPAADGGVVLAIRGARREGISPLIASLVHALLALGAARSYE